MKYYLTTPIYYVNAAPHKVVLGFHGHDPSVQRILGNYTNDPEEQQNRAEDGNWARLNRLFNTHPPLADRIAALREL